MRLLMISLAVCVTAIMLGTLPAEVRAASAGHQALITMTYTMDLSGLNLPQSKSHQTKGSKTPPAPAVDQTTSGVMYWTSTRSRVEMDMKEAGKTVSICDWDKQEMYSLDSKTKTARKIDLNHDIPGLSSQLGSSMTYGMDWDKTVANMKKVSGATLRESGTATVNGLQCVVYDYTIDMSKVITPSTSTATKGKQQQDATISEVIKSLGIGKGKIWASKEFNIAVKMELAMGGMQMKYQLDNIASWDVDESMFKIPVGYKIVSNSTTPTKKPSNPAGSVHDKH